MGIFEVCAGDISGNGIQPLRHITHPYTTYRRNHDEIRYDTDTDNKFAHLVVLILDSLRYSLPKVIRSR